MAFTGTNSSRTQKNKGSAMANLAESTTNPQSNTCIDANCDCKIIWSLAHQYAMAQLDTRTPILKDGTPDYRFSSHSISETKIEPGDASFVGKNYGARARRVASSYARMFLEDFHLGKRTRLAGSIGPGWGRSPPSRFRLTWKAGRWTRCPAWVSSTRDSAKAICGFTTTY